MNIPTANEKMILVVGGAGYIGSHMTKLLQQSGYIPIVLDNLSTGTQSAIGDAIFFAGDASDDVLIKKIYNEYPFSAMMHFAAFIEVGESVQNPLKYYANNVATTIQLLACMRELAVKNIVFSSSAAVYGAPVATIDEAHPKAPLNPYGQTKLMVEQILKDFSRAHHVNVTCLRYFNVAGGDPTIHAGVRGRPSSNLIPIVMQAVLHDKPVTIFGNDWNTKDGTCLRDYIHVVDLCEAHLLALNELQNETVAQFHIYNLGTGHGYSVMDVILEAERVTKKNIQVKIGERRAGDPEILVADGTLAKQQLNWQPTRSELSRIIHDAWQYEMQRTAKKNEKASISTRVKILLGLGLIAFVGYQLLSN